MVLAPGHAHLHAIKFLHRDSFLANPEYSGLPGACVG